MSVKVRDRPERTYRTGPFTRMVRLLSLLVIAMVTVGTIYLFPALPETIPADGAEESGSDSRSSVLWLSGLMVALAGLLAWLSFRPRLFNYPAELTEENAQAVYREGERMMVALLAAQAVLHLGLVMLLIGGGGAAGEVFAGCGVVGMVAISFGGIIRLSRVADRGTRADGV